MLKEPNSMDECVYYTLRDIGKGKIRCWVYKQKCPKCGKALMGKPRDEKGKIKIRAKEVQCPSCKYTLDEKEYEDGLTAEANYTCPNCGKQGEAKTPYKRKKVKIMDEEDGKLVTVDVLRFNCEHCKANIDVSKKMKGA